MKNRKRLMIFVTLIVFLLFCCTSFTYGVDQENTFKIIEDSVEQKLETEKGTLSKKIIASDLKSGKITIELSLSNKASQYNVHDETEIYFVMDRSLSMDTAVGSQTRRAIVGNSAKVLAQKILQKEKIKIGLIEFSGEKGDLSDAKIRLYPTSQISVVNSSINSYLKDGLLSNTNIDAGLTLAQNSFTQNTNKIIVLLTDGIPTHALGTDTLEKAHEKTANTIKQFPGKGIQLITMLTQTVNASNGPIINQVFGTPEKPYAGKFYYIADANIENVVTQDIFKNVIETIDQTIHQIKITDYFPKEITDHFNFSYIGDPSKGNVSGNINSSNNKIEWQIDTVGKNETVSLKYELQLKDMNHKDIFNKIIATNEKVDLSYQDSNLKTHEIILSNSPKIKLVTKQEDNNGGNDGENQDNKNDNNNNNNDDNNQEGQDDKENNNNANKEQGQGGQDQNNHNTDTENENKKQDDITTLKGKLPQTGLNDTFLYIIGISSMISVLLFMKYKKYQKMLK